MEVGPPDITERVDGRTDLNREMQELFEDQWVLESCLVSISDQDCCALGRREALLLNNDVIDPGRDSPELKISPRTEVGGASKLGELFLFQRAELTWVDHGLELYFGLAGIERTEGAERTANDCPSPPQGHLAQIAFRRRLQLDIPGIVGRILTRIDPEIPRSRRNGALGQLPVRKGAVNPVCAIWLWKRAVNGLGRCKSDSRNLRSAPVLRWREVGLQRRGRPQRQSQDGPRARGVRRRTRLRTPVPLDGRSSSPRLAQIDSYTGRASPPLEGYSDDDGRTVLLILWNEMNVSFRRK